MEAEFNEAKAKYIEETNKIEDEFTKASDEALTYKDVNAGQSIVCPVNELYIKQE